MWWSIAGKTMAGGNTTQCHFLYHKSHMDTFIRIQVYAVLGQNWPPEQWHGPHPTTSHLILWRHIYWSNNCIVLSIDADSPYWESTLAPNPLLLLHPTLHELKYHTHTCSLNPLQNTIKWFTPSEHYNIYNQQHPSMATNFSPFLDHPQANI